MHTYGFLSMRRRSKDFRDAGFQKFSFFTGLHGIDHISWDSATYHYHLALFRSAYTNALCPRIDDLELSEVDRFLSSRHRLQKYIPSADNRKTYVIRW